jgi:hypothetical protein
VRWRVVMMGPPELELENGRWSVSLELELGGLARRALPLASMTEVRFHSHLYAATGCFRALAAVQADSADRRMEMELGTPRQSRHPAAAG